MEALAEEDEVISEVSAMDETLEQQQIPSRPPQNIRRSTLHLIERAVSRLVRAGGRKTEGDAPHLLEAIAVLVYDPDTATLSDGVPPVGSGLRWDEFVDSIASAYRGRFEP